MAKRFFYVCAGMLMLALAFHLGATSAQSQSANKLVDVAWRRSDGFAYAVTSAGEIWANPGNCGSFIRVGQMPAGCVPVTVLDGDVGGSLDIGCENGQFYTVVGAVPNVQLQLCSSIFGGPTPITSQSFGALKAKYR